MRATPRSPGLNTPATEEDPSMTRIAIPLVALATLAFVGFGVADPAAARRAARGELVREAGDAGPPRPPSAVGHPGFLSPHASPIAASGGYVYAANTPADTVDVIDASTRAVVARVNVGIQPVGLAVRPDGKEVWVANHVSDSVSVIDADPASPTRFQVLATVQDLDPASRSTRFDEPVGIAFAGNGKAYVALSSENQVAVVDVGARKVVKRLDIAAQDPRAIAVRGDRLYVLPFESGNKTQLSGGREPFDGDLVTFDAWKHSVLNNNVLSLGAVVDIVKHPAVPDRDLYVFDTKTDELVKVVDTLGTLLYGLAVDSRGRVYVAQTDARNDANGRAGTKKHGLAELGNRAFLNRITSLELRGDSAGSPKFIDLEPLPPENPASGKALATPYAIAVSDDDATLVATAAGSNKVFTVDAATGEVLGRADVGAIPEGIALESAQGGRPSRAWVLNAGSDSVSLVDLSRPESPRVEATVPLEDPTPPKVRRGRIAFHDANASTTGTFSCASCHPDGHTDQLLWVLNTPIVTGGDQIMPRSTMPARGLRDTEPYHWDGIPGDPYGGINSASIHGNLPPNSRVDDQETSTRHLIDGGLANTMALVGDKAVNDEGKPGKLSKAERDDMATFLLSVPYPPAQRRAYTNVLSDRAAKGFELFHVSGDNDPTKPRPNVCGDCHRMPFWTSTNTPGTGMDAPTWRGAYDRWLILPQGRLNIIAFPFYKQAAEKGAPERSIWRFSWSGRPRFDPVWDMVLEGSTGFPGAYARQATLNRETAKDARTADLLDALERAAREGGVVLQGEGVFLDDGKATPVAFEYDGKSRGGAYVKRDGDREALSRETLASLALDGRFLGTFTARLGARVDVDHPQPALWTLGPIADQRGHQQFPVLVGKDTAMTFSGRHIDDGARVIVDGIGVAGTVSLDGETVRVELAALPPVGMHFLQVQNPDGLFSNDFIFHVAKDEAAARALRHSRLGDVLRDAKWGRLIGTWVDEPTGGKTSRTTFAWKIKDVLIESAHRDSSNESFALIGVNPETGEVFHNGADRGGSMFAGKWEFSPDGDATLNISYVNTDAQKGTLKLRYRLKDDTLELRAGGPDSRPLKLIRSESN
jgi:YVTN family beta-propeller protein